MWILNSHYPNGRITIFLGLAFVLALHVADPQRAPAAAQNTPPKSEKGTGEQSANQRDYSGEDLVIEQATKNVTFSSDGTGEQEQFARIRIQSENGVKQFGVLSFAYSSDNERYESIEIRVKKPDGRVVATPDSNVQDLPAEVTRIAPTYSSLREKQVPVKALGVGDVLEWRSRSVQTKAEVAGQFWMAHDFTKDHIVLEDLLRVTVPADKYVKVSSPSLKPETRDENGRRIYTWKTSRLELPKVKPTANVQNPVPPDVQLTTFKSWAEVGQWYGTLQKSKLEVTPLVRAKAEELTKDSKTDAEKMRAIYEFVSTKFRYISISFGAGRYQPHAAEEVLANQYGDCKDKHTLFAALLRAVGIEAWPALIGAGLGFDPDVPSPAQFNHVITYVPQGTSAVWLDTTPEVAPYGLLFQFLRDRQALVIPDRGTPSVMTTAKEPPFPSDENVRIESKLAPDGTLTGHFDINVRGDVEVILRSVFHATAPAQWSTLAQNMAAAMGYAGTVSDLDVDNPAVLERPFHYSFNYERKNYPDWAHRRVTPPLPPLTLLPYEEDNKPSEPTYFGAPGSFAHHAAMELPPGYSAEIPGDVKLRTEFADYTSTYSVDKGVLSVDRVLVIEVSKLKPEQWDAYRQFAKAVVTDETQFIQLVRADAAASTHVAREVPEAAELIQRAGLAMQNRDLNAARDALAQAERLNPEQLYLWVTYAVLYEQQGQTEKVIDAVKKEIQYHPGSEGAYRMLAAVQQRQGHLDDAVDTLRRLVKIAPQNADGVLQLASILISQKKYGDAIGPLQVALKEDTNNTRLQTSLLEALLRGGQKTEGLAILAKMREQTLDADTLNSAAWFLADTDTDGALAKELARQAVSEFESQLKDVTLQALSSEQLRVVNVLGATWDTLGWAAFRLNDLGTAEKYIHSAWLLLQHPTAADHLGQVYERQGKKAEAIHAYQLALAVKSDQPETRQRLEKLGGTTDDDRPTLRRGKPTGAAPHISADDELPQLRTAGIPELTFQHGSAEFFLLFSATGVEDVKFVRGDEDLSAAATALGKAQYQMPFPDHGPEKIARRGILSCSQYTKPNCSIMFLLPANTTN